MGVLDELELPHMVFRYYVPVTYIVLHQEKFLYIMIC